MDFTPISQIVIPENRIRRKFDEDAKNDLQASIERQGLFHPLLVRDDGCTLISGERRLRCLTDIFARRRSVLFDGKQLIDAVPTVRLHDQDAVGVLEAELAENTRRQQLTWQEQAAATEALHRLRTTTSITHSRRDTARELNRAEHNVNDDILVAGWLNDEEVEAATTRKDALKIIERKLDNLHRAKLAEAYNLPSDNDLQLFNTTMRDAVARYQFPPFDLIIADPPYGLDAQNWDNQSAVKHSYEDTLDGSNLLYSFIATSIPVAAAAHSYVFCDTRRFPAISAIFQQAGWRVWPWPLIWARGNSVGLLPWPEHGPRRTYEGILYAVRGDRRTTGVYADVILVPHDSTTERGAHKPPALYAELIKRSCLPGDRVVDPCCGTGAIFPAARSCNVRAVGFEPEEAAYHQALMRIKDAIGT